MLFALRAGIVLIGADLIRKVIKYKPKDFDDEVDDEVDEETDEETDTESVEPETHKKGIKGLISKAKEYYHDNFDSSDETLEEEYNREHPNDNVIAFPTKQVDNTEETNDEPTNDEPTEDATAEEVATDDEEVESKPRLRDRIKKIFTIEDPEDTKEDVNDSEDITTDEAYGYKKNLIRQDVLEDNVTEISFANDTATTEIYTLSLHVALPIYTE